MIHLVQIGNGSSRRVALVEEPHLRCLTEVQSVYELAQEMSGARRRTERRWRLRSRRARRWTTTRSMQGRPSGVCSRRSMCRESLRV